MLRNVICMLIYIVPSSLLWKVTKTVRRPVTGLLALRPGLNPRPVHVGFVIDIESLGQVHGHCLYFICIQETQHNPGN
jgi:hypothetical protein